MIKKLPVGARRTLPPNRKPLPYFSSLVEFSAAVAIAETKRKGAWQLKNRLWLC
jgi:hypothetical protein